MQVCNRAQLRASLADAGRKDRFGISLVRGMHGFPWSRTVEMPEGFLQSGAHRLRERKT